VTAVQTLRAPTFDLVAEELAALLTGRVVVAHNLRVDGTFLAAGYAWLGYRVPLGHIGLCTMLHAHRYLPGAGRSLADCCAAYGITISDAHHAGSDAFATARLLGDLRADTGGPRWAQEFAVAAEHPWPVFTLPRGEWIAREDAESHEHFLARLPETLSPKPSEAGQVEYAGQVGCAGQVEYLALLDRALLDRNMSVAEADALVSVAAEAGISRATAIDLQRAYLVEVARTTAEPQELSRVAELLGLTDVDVERAQRAAADGRPALVVRRFVLTAGDKVASTGEMDRERSEWERLAARAGLPVHPAVTKQVKFAGRRRPGHAVREGSQGPRLRNFVITEDAFAGMLDRGIG
jgi:DNA polymerase-3 subunit epsilon